MSGILINVEQVELPIPKSEVMKFTYKNSNGKIEEKLFIKNL